MPDFKIVFTSYALKMLDEIFDFIKIESGSAKTAQNLVDRIIDRTKQLADMPHSGAIEPCLREFDVRYLIEGAYKIHYKVSNNRIIITDVFHTSRNPSSMHDST